jgi:hypothetical protein
MAASTTHPSRVVVTVIACALCAGVAAAFLGRGPAAPETVSAAPAAKQATVSQVLVARRSGGHDALWLLSQADGSATAAGSLPGFAGSVAVAPDGQNVAYLPESGAPRVWLGYGPLAPRNISLVPAGVKQVDSLVWITDDKLLVSGVTTGRYADPRKDRLFLVTASTGKVRSFRGLRGTEPSAAPGVGQVAYVKLTTLDNGSPRNGNSPLINESLKLLRLDRSGGGRTVTSERYREYADHRALSQPKLSPTGAWLLTGQTGSDVRVTYAVREAQLGYPFLTVFAPALQAEAGWDAAGRRTAFAGTPSPLTQQEACVWVYDVVTGTMTRTPGGLLPDLMIGELAWSASGDLVAGAFGVGSPIRHVLVMPGDLASVKDLGTGRLPAWVRQ